MAKRCTEDVLNESFKNKNVTKQKIELDINQEKWPLFHTSNEPPNYFTPQMNYPIISHLK